MIGWPVAVGMLAHAAHWWALTVWHVDLAGSALVSCLIAGAPAGPDIALSANAVRGHRVRVRCRIGARRVRLPDAQRTRAVRAPAESGLLTALTSDGAVAVLVIAGMATGLAVPMHAYAALAAAAEKRRN